MADPKITPELLALLKKNGWNPPSSADEDINAAHTSMYGAYGGMDAELVHPPPQPVYQIPHAPRSQNGTEAESPRYMRDPDVAAWMQPRPADPYANPITAKIKAREALEREQAAKPHRQGYPEENRDPNVALPNHWAATDEGAERAIARADFRRDNPQDEGHVERGALGAQWVPDQPDAAPKVPDGPDGKPDFLSHVRSWFGGNS